MQGPPDLLLIYGQRNGDLRMPRALRALSVAAYGDDGPIERPCNFNLEVLGLKQALSTWASMVSWPIVESVPTTRTTSRIMATFNGKRSPR